MLRRQDQSLKDIVQTLRIFHENVDDRPDADSTDKSGNYSPSQKEILEALVAALDTPDAG